MDFQALCELADREIRIGTFDRVLMSKALTEAKGVTVHAHQIYWRLRAMSWQDKVRSISPVDANLYLNEIKARVDADEKSRRLRANIVGWLWVVACFTALVGAATCFLFAAAAFNRGGSAIYGYSIGGVSLLVIGIVAFIICKRDAGQNPFLL